VVDIGGTKVLVVLWRDGGIVARARLQSHGVTDPSALVEAISGAALGLAEREKLTIRSALIAVPGTIDRDLGIVQSAANLPFRQFALSPSLSRRLGGVRVIMEDDANCGAVGEATAGAGQGAEDLVYVTLSTGIGMGALVGGRLVIGAHGTAGELGHLEVVPGGRACGCGAQGCLEAYASGRAIASLGQALVDNGGGAILGGVASDGAAITAPDVVAGAQQGDAGCLEIINQAVALIRRSVHMLHRILDPEVVVLGGGLMSNPFFAELALSRGAGQDQGTGPVVRGAALGDDSVVVGGMHVLAARLASDGIRESL
jgi:glucokinase